MYFFFYLSLAKEKKAISPFEQEKRKQKYVISSVTPVGQGLQRLLNWRMKESKVVSDISGLGNMAISSMEGCQVPGQAWKC